jgi:hypothetical protein
VDLSSATWPGPGGVGHVVHQRGPEPFGRVVVRAGVRSLQDLGPRVLGQVGVDGLGVVDAVPLGDSVLCCDLGFCCTISSMAGTISRCCCR